jgi:histidine ammonia-lyase
MIEAENMRRLLEGSYNAKWLQETKVQDPYSQRCLPQSHGASRDAIQYVYDKVTTEINAVTDNPLVFAEEDEVISGGNFHGEPMALPFDFLGIACAELASISERRIEWMVNAALSNGLTPFLTTEAGLNSGYMIVQYTAASMASENKVFAHPASVDTIPSSANQEDFVSMGTTAARKSGLILENTRSILAYELLTACQAIDIRRMVGPWGEGLSPVLDKVYARVREMIPFCPEDRELRLDIEKIEPLVRGTEIDEIVENQLPDFE